MQHHFDIEIASEYGLIEAILLDNFWFWVCKNEANEKNYHDGNYWTYNSTKAMTKLFPYLSQRKIQNALGRLIDSGVLVTGNYNASKYDRTLWYAFTEKGKCIMQKREMEHDKMSNETYQKGKPIPYTNPDVKTNNKPDMFADVPCDIKDLFMEWVDMRKSIKKPVTTKRTVTRALNELNRLSQDTAERRKIIEQAVDKCWLGFYPLKEEKPVKNAYTPPEPPKRQVFKPEDRADTCQMPDEIRKKMQNYEKELGV